MVIAFVGKERCNIAYFLYKAAESTGKRTLVVDNSKKGDLYRVLTDGEGNHKSLPNGDIVRLFDVTDDEASRYDLVILYQGLYEVDMEYDLTCDSLYVATSMNRLEVEDTKKALESAQFTSMSTNCKFILLDNSAQKYSLDGIAQECGIPSKPVGYTVLSLDENDLRKYTILCNERKARLVKGSSTEMKNLIYSIVQNEFGVDIKTAKKVCGRI